MNETTHMKTAEAMGLGTVSAMIDDDGVLIVTDEEGTIIEYEGTEAIILWSLMAS